ncbi:hypothetical protein [Sinorhizobium mexicanum]|uniref:Uncharacterized protein n=1 Tax=Sinorhizobium mexicanum TaxID=375549 RepID=A0A859QG28_9HYPH|nr:hypothetical protein [Sinorhizobium mexicanum]MBP1884580.1 hypothetical protein [Sinorhizobium mexicanum]QLL65483.1 hypothetical protein FKV68_29605 [Sinorhizobium mexicanum]
MVAVEQALPSASQLATRIIKGGRVLACPVDEASLLVIGTGERMAGTLLAEINDDDATRGTASVTGWRLASPSRSATHGFAALLQMKDTGRPLSTLRLGEEADKRYIFTPRLVPVSDAAVILAELAGEQIGDTLDSLTDALMQGTVGPRRLAAIIALLQSRKGSDGSIELLGETQDGVIFVKGWSRIIEPGSCRVVVNSAKPAFCDCGIATFLRQDVPAGGSGFVGLLSTREPLRVRDIEGLVYRGRGGWRYAPVHEHRQVAGPSETPGHIRSVLLQTRSSPQVLLELRSAANSFEGRETVSALPVPVRMGIDSAFQVSGGAFLISGWLLDPEAHVQSVKLCSGRAATRLDDNWSRLERSDVTDAFTDEPAFRSAFDHDSPPHGFIAFVSGPGWDSAISFHLELTLRDSRRAFMPLTPIRVPPRVAVLRQISAIDPEHWGIAEIVDRQIVPFLCASERTSPSIAATVDAGPFEQAGGPPIVIAAKDTEDGDIAPILGLLALDPETRLAPIALVLPAERFRRQASRVKELAQFYRLSLKLMAAEESGDLYDLLEAGVRALSHETVVLLAGSLLPLRAGWYGKLVAAHDTQGGVISPTLAYEDHSVRWTGSWPAGQSEYPALSRYAGYPLSAVTGLKLTQVAAASFECCILPREAFLVAGGFSGGYLGSQQKGLDLGLRLSRSGIPSYWLPAVQMLGADESSGAATAALAPLVKRIDRRIFASRWAPARHDSWFEEVSA